MKNLKSFQSGHARARYETWTPECEAVMELGRDKAFEQHEGGRLHMAVCCLQLPELCVTDFHRDRHKGALRLRFSGNATTARNIEYSELDYTVYVQQCYGRCDENSCAGQLLTRFAISSALISPHVPHIQYKH